MAVNGTSEVCPFKLTKRALDRFPMRIFSTSIARTIEARREFNGLTIRLTGLAARALGLPRIESLPKVLVAAIKYQEHNQNALFSMAKDSCTYAAAKSHDKSSRAFRDSLLALGMFALGYFAMDQYGIFSQLSGSIKEAFPEFGKYEPYGQLIALGVSSILSVMLIARGIIFKNSSGSMELYYWLVSKMNKQ